MSAVQAPRERLLTPAEVAALVFVDPKTVSRWASAGKIASTRTPGGHRRFRRSDVEPLLPRGKGQDFDVDRAATETAVAAAIASALETQAAAAAEAVLETAASVAAAVLTVASAAAKARRSRASAAAEAAHLVATEAADAAAAMRSNAMAQVGRLAGSSSDAELAAALVAQAVTDSAARVAGVVAAAELALERETSAAAKALHNLTMEKARHLARTNDAVTRRTLALRGVRT